MNKKMDDLLDLVNSDILMDMVQQVNNWDGSLDYLDFIDMDILENYLLKMSVIDIINRIYYGDFNPNDSYFKFDGYGNLVSYSKYTVKQNLESYKEEIVKRFVELCKQGHVDSYYQEALDILGNDIEEE